jgi:hypothetical protein
MVRSEEERQDYGQMHYFVSVGGKDGGSGAGPWRYR